MSERSEPARFPSGVLGIYALATIEREGRAYGYELSERIAQRTDGAWRPGAGAVYPALELLAARGLVRSTREGRRRVYRITPSGRAHLRRVRRRIAWRNRGGRDLGWLWAEIAGHTDPGEFLLARLGRQLDAVTRFLAREAEAGSERADLRRRLSVELELARSRLDRPPARPGARRAAGTEPTR